MFRRLISCFKNDTTANLLFISAGVFYFAANCSYLLNHPTGIHFIRQTDTISFSLFYLKNSDFNFFKIGNLNLDFAGGHTACEFPLFYYLYFILFKFFGVNFVIIRVISLLLFSWSIYRVAKSTKLLINSSLQSVLIVYLVVSSSVLRYYSVNFLPDSIALSLCFLGLSYTVNFSFTRLNKHFILSLSFLTLASLLKIYYGIYLFLSISYLVTCSQSINRRLIFGYIICTLLVFSWYIFAVFYNKLYKADYYLTTIRPIWNLSQSEVSVANSSIFNYWYTKFYLPTIFHFFIILGMLVLVLRAMKTRMILFLLVAIAAGISYVFLFYGQFRDHDYYFMALIPIFYFFAALSIKALNEYFKWKYFKIFIITILATIVIAGFNYTSVNMNRRFNNSVDSYSIVNYRLKGVSVYLDSLGVKNNSKFLVIGDNTVNGSLVFLNKQGWVYKDFENYVDKVNNAFAKADYLLILEPSKNAIPESLKNKLKNSRRFNYCNNFIYTLN